MELSEVILPAAIGSGGTLLGVIVTNWHTMKIARMNREHSQLGEERVRLDILAQTMNRWSSNMTLLYPFYRTAESKDLIEFVDTDSGRKNTKDGETITNLISSGKILSVNENVRQSYEAIDDLRNEFGRETLQKMIDKKSPITMAEVLANQKTFISDFTQIVDHISDLLNHANRPLWLKAWRRVRGRSPYKSML